MITSPDRIPCVVDCDLYNVFGKGVDPTWQAILDKKTAFSDCHRFSKGKFKTTTAGIAPDAEENGIANIPKVFADYLATAASKMPDDTEVFLASTIGLIDYWNNSENRCTSDMLLEYILKKFHKNNGRVVSAACASVNTAFASVNNLIRRKRLDSAMVVGTDYVSEFIFSGFSTLRAMASNKVSPYDINRDGLLLGDSASIVSICSEKKARELGKTIQGKIVGTGYTCDAYHITAPIPSGDALIRAIQNALDMAGLQPQDVGAVIGHGTGTVYNDAMELNALHHFYGDVGIPLMSVKANAGHTLAGAGLLQMCIALKMLETRVVPAQTGLVTPEPMAVNYVSSEQRKLNIPRIMCMNSGFGGLNAVVIVEADQV